MATTSPSGLIGRDEELAVIRGFLDSPAPSALLIEGEAGCGKTTLWQAGAAQATSHRVLACRPSDTESALAFSGIGDLLAEIDPEALGVLPTPQRRALEIALLLAEPDPEPPNPRALAVAFLGVLRGLAANEPLLVAIDDVQWLDAPSAEMLAFAVRRLRDEPIHLLAAQRRVTGDEPPGIDLDRAPRLERLPVGSLDLEETRRLVAGHFGRSLPRAVVGRVHAAAGGEVAAELHVTVNTVEKTLSRIYAKLGIHSRSALASRLGAVTPDPAPPAARSSS
jgi:AAA ATPase domain